MKKKNNEKIILTVKMKNENFLLLISNIPDDDKYNIPLEVNIKCPVNNIHLFTRELKQCIVNNLSSLLKN